MFHKKTYLDRSNIHGIGLFAGEYIQQGEQIWTPSVTLNYLVDQDIFLTLPEEDQEIFKHYGYFHKEHQQRHLSSEDIRFTNHSSSDSNITRNKTNEGVLAKRDIEQGEELTQDYSEFELLRFTI